MKKFNYSEYIPNIGYSFTCFLRLIKFTASFSSTTAISCRPVLLMEGIGVSGKIRGPLVSI